MLTAILAGIVALAASVAILAFFTTGIAALLVYATRLELQVYVSGVARYLQGMRLGHFTDRGLNPSRARLRRQTREEARGLLHVVRTGEELPREGAPLEALLELGDATKELTEGLTTEERSDLQDGLRSLGAQLQARWAAVRLCVTMILSTALAIGLSLDAIDIIAGVVNGVGTWVPFSNALDGKSFTLQSIGGMLICGLIGGAISARFVDRVLSRHRGIAQSEAAKADDRSPSSVGVVRKEEEKERTLGKGREVVRVLNLSAGGYDTMMQLGVAHALLVIQGRAPDAIVGVSAGAVQGAAIAAVLQAGQPSDSDKSRGAADSSAGNRRTLARVATLRRFIQAAREAPAELANAVLPDTFQIDAHRALTPLRHPRFYERETRHRTESVVIRSGLTRLYNDLLNIPFSVGTLTGMLRRWLSLKAAGNLHGRLRILAVQFVEITRLWALLGQNLPGASTLIPIFVRAVNLREHSGKLKTVTAGDLVSRVAFLRGAWFFLRGALSIVAAFLVWLAFTTFPVLPVAILLTVVLTIWCVFARDDRALQGALPDMLWGLGALIALYLMWGGIVLTTIHYSMVLLGSALGTTTIVMLWCIGFFVSLIIGWLVWIHPRPFVDRLLAAYSLDDSLLEPHRLRTLLRDTFDEGYYTHKPIDEVVEAALRPEQEPPQEPSPRPMRIGDFIGRAPPIHLGVAVANTTTGALDIVQPNTTLVDALLAAVSVAPWLPAIELEGPKGPDKPKRVLYMDGANIARDPSDALFALLRERLHSDPKVVHVYSVAPLPSDGSELERVPEATKPATSEDKDSRTDPVRSADSTSPYINLVDIAWRAWRLRRLRDATLQRRLTNLVTQAMPTGRQNQAGSNYIRAWVTPIEPEFDIDLNRRVIGADKGTRHRVIEEAIAEGCRAAMQVMIPHAIAQAATRSQGAPAKSVYCRVAVREHLRCKVEIDPDAAGALFGSDENGGPGLSEICRHCRLRKRPTDWGGQSTNIPTLQALRVDDANTAKANQFSSWPHENDADVSEADQPYVRSATSHYADEKKRQVEGLKSLAATDTEHRQWPKDDRHPKGKLLRPTVSFLFSGGVFRGVYQMGVLNAFSQIGLRPDIIGGASVGSITAAMIAEAFALEDTARAERIARLTAVFLGIDRLILTDRLANFVRALTIRAADTQFSIRQADRFFRKYDYPGLREFNRNARHVIAGIERLLYLSPYKLNELVRAVRNGDVATAGREIRDAVQQFLDRMEVGEEALGAEALASLIDEYVPTAKGASGTIDTTFDEFREKTEIQLLMTATNLTRSRLDVLGTRPEVAREAATVRGAILASSAFPGVFRPRWAWEIHPGGSHQDRYIDGGVMDNLPLDSVAEFLHSAAQAGLIEYRPKILDSGNKHAEKTLGQSSVPHLLVGASLEVDAANQSFAFRPEELKQSWRIRSQRARQLSYNMKLNMYVRTEDRLRDIADQLASQPGIANSIPAFEPVNIQVIPIKPAWLCGTFAFHPMLGFRRRQQAQSIAHGCASTLLRFAQFAHESGKQAEIHRQWLDAWKVDKKALPKTTSWQAGFKEARPYSESVKEGLCWLTDRKCPFSSKSLVGLKPANTRGEISEIHLQCLEHETHLKPI